MVKLFQRGSKFPFLICHFSFSVAFSEAPLLYLEEHGIDDGDEDERDECAHEEAAHDSDGKAATTIQLAAIHNSAGNVKIIGWDNIVITNKESTDAIDIREFDNSKMSNSKCYDLSGRRVDSNIDKLQPGTYVVNGRIIIKR